jgi:DNA invertase Pin-like site-specific DNA recombinase
MTAPQITAYSYRRYSSGKQASGTSLERQLEKAQEVCEEMGWVLDTSYTDPGLSGYHGHNKTIGALGSFLKAIGKGVKVGSVLIVENLDRLSREEIDPAGEIIKGILRKGVELYVCDMKRHYTKASLNDPLAVIEWCFNQYRAHQESERKADFAKKNWRSKREKAAKGEIAVKDGRKASPHRCPGWIKWNKVEQKWEENENADVVRKMYSLCISGYGFYRIVQFLNREGIKTFVQRKKWSLPAVSDIFSSKSVLGEIVLGGKTIKGYYPAIIKESTYYKAQAVIHNRSSGGGRVKSNQSTVSNLFTGLAFFGDSSATVASKGTGRYLVSSDGQIGAGEYIAFPYCTFEDHFFHELMELNPLDIVEREETEDNLPILESKLQGINRNIDRMRERLRNGADYGTLEDMIDTLDAEKGEVLAAIEREKQKNHTGGANHIVDLQAIYAKAAEFSTAEIRMRIKALLRSLVERIDLEVEKITDTKAKVRKGRQGRKIKIIKAIVKFRSGATRQIFISTKGTSMSLYFDPTLPPVVIDPDMF